MAAETLNKVIFGGRVAADAEIRYTQDGKPVCHIRFVLGNRKKGDDGEWKDDPMWMRVTCFGRLAERYSERPLLKGQRITVIGRIDTPYIYNGERGSGVNISVVADEIARYDFDESAQRGGNDEEFEDARPARQPAAQRSQPAKAAAPPADDLDDLPF
jgi:single-strand DNA-binding protein